MEHPYFPIISMQPPPPPTSAGWTLHFLPKITPIFGHQLKELVTLKSVLWEKRLKQVLG